MLAAPSPSPSAREAARPHIIRSRATDPPFSGKTTTVGLPRVYGVVSSGHRAEPKRCANHATLSVSVAVPALSLFLTERADIPAAAHPSRYRSRAERSSAVRPHRDLRSSSRAGAHDSSEGLLLRTGSVTVRSAVLSLLLTQGARSRSPRRLRRRAPSWAPRRPAAATYGARPARSSP